MKILLVGEYSRLHNSLKEGLVQLEHDVTLISTGDFFKNYPSDIKLKRRFDTGISKKIKSLLYRLTVIDITSLSLKKQFLAHYKDLQGFDVVQLINESPFAVTPATEKEIIHKLAAANQKLILLCCGTDYISVQHALSDAHPYSILTPFKKGVISAKQAVFILRRANKSYKKLHEFVYSKIAGVIASDMDYHIPLKNHPKYLGLIPNPINLSKLKYAPLKVEETIYVFMGINRGNYHAKGIVYFEKALAIISKKYGASVHIEIVENLPYDEYMSRYHKAHIVLDQVYAYDQGYNALEAMARGKVVFTGAEKEFNAYYGLEEQVAINALPDVEYLVEQLATLIENPTQMIAMGKRAHEFVAKHHDCVKVAEKYVETWQKA